MTNDMTKKKLFLELAKPDSEGISRWVDVNEFKGKYVKLNLGNGASWARKESALAKQYIVEFDKSITKGNRIDKIRLAGLNDNDHSQYINSKIKKAIKSEKCVILGTSNPEVDHKNGRKNESRVMKNENQQLSDFQPLSKAANDAKRQHCKNCSNTGKRFDAKQLGYPISFWTGDEFHNEAENGCIGCYWHDILKFKNHLKSN